MEIKTKFDVGAITERKYNSSNEGYYALEVMEISSQTCYAGTQVFYHCRQLIITKTPNWRRKEDETVKEWNIAHGVNKQHTSNTVAWEKYREDELIEASAKILEILQSVA